MSSVEAEAVGWWQISQGVVSGTVRAVEGPLQQQNWQATSSSVPIVLASTCALALSIRTPVAHRSAVPSTSTALAPLKREQIIEASTTSWARVGRIWLPATGCSHLQHGQDLTTGNAMNAESMYL